MKGEVASSNPTWLWGIAAIWSKVLPLLLKDTIQWQPITNRNKINPNKINICLMSLIKQLTSERILPERRTGIDRNMQSHSSKTKLRFSFKSPMRMGTFLHYLVLHRRYSRRRKPLWSLARSHKRGKVSITERCPTGTCNPSRYIEHSFVQATYSAFCSAQTSSNRWISSRMSCGRYSVTTYLTIHAGIP